MPNYKILLTPKPPPPGCTVAGIIECGYIWPYEITTERVVSAEDLQKLRDETTRTAKDPITKKVRNVARFILGNVEETTAEADPTKVPDKTTAREQLPKSRDEYFREQSTALLEIAKISQETNRLLTTHLSQQALH